VQPGDRGPQDTQHAENEKRVVEPQPAASVDSHQNTCSFEQVFGGKGRRRHNRVTDYRPRLVVAALATTLAAGACLPDPHSAQLVDLLDRLVRARAMLAEAPPRATEACDVVGEVQNRLDGEPGLVDVRAAWPALRSATTALQAVCGLTSLASAPSSVETAALRDARERWQAGIQRELGAACDRLRDGAASLGRPSPC
jgi:hypothetical protein